jgi:predicted TIM-barrel fold metal-dependent hydrolase
MVKAIDIVVNLWTTEVTASYPPHLDEFWDLMASSRSLDRFAGTDTTHKGIPLADEIAEMDRAGVEKGLLLATTGGDVGSAIFFEKHIDIIHRTCQQYPDRFKGIVGINPSKILDWLTKLDRAVCEYGFVGAHIYPHWFGKPPDHRVYYPFYARCAQLGVPVQIQVGHSMQWFLETVAPPILLDKIAIDFPTLKIIGIHTGHPWTEEMISVAWKHKNVFIGTDAHAPRYWDPSLVRFLNSRGQDKVLFGTDWPIIGFDRAIREIDALELKDGPKQKLLRDNAIRVYGLENWV